MANKKKLTRSSSAKQNVRTDEYNQEQNTYFKNFIANNTSRSIANSIYAEMMNNHLMALNDYMQYGGSYYGGTGDDMTAFGYDPSRGNVDNYIHRMQQLQDGNASAFAGLLDAMSNYKNNQKQKEFTKFNPLYDKEFLPISQDEAALTNYQAGRETGDPVIDPFIGIGGYRGTQRDFRYNRPPTAHELSNKRAALMSQLPTNHSRWSTNEVEQSSSSETQRPSGWFSPLTGEYIPYNLTTLSPFSTNPFGSGFGNTNINNIKPNPYRTESKEPVVVNNNTSAAKSTTSKKGESITGTDVAGNIQQVTSGSSGGQGRATTKGDEVEDTKTGTKTGDKKVTEGTKTQYVNQQPQLRNFNINTRRALLKGNRFKSLEASFYPSYELYNLMQQGNVAPPYAGMDPDYNPYTNPYYNRQDSINDNPIYDTVENDEDLQYAQYGGGAGGSGTPTTWKDPWQDDEYMRYKLKSTPDYMGNTGRMIGPALDFAAMIGRAMTEPNYNKQLEKMSSADQLFTPGYGNKGFNTFNKVGYDPGDRQTPVQFTGMAKKGGSIKKYQEGGTYSLTQDEIDRLLESGAEIEYLD